MPALVRRRVSRFQHRCEVIGRAEQQERRVVGFVGSRPTQAHSLQGLPRVHAPGDGGRTSTMHVAERGAGSGRAQGHGVLVVRIVWFASQLHAATWSRSATRLALAWCVLLLA